MFNILVPQAIKKIVRMQVDIVKERMEQKNILLEVAPKVFDYLAREGYDPQYGARPLKRLIQSKMLTELASLIISRGVGEGGVVAVDMRGENLEFKVKKQGKRQKTRKTKKSSASKAKAVA